MERTMQPTLPSERARREQEVAHLFRRRYPELVRVAYLLTGEAAIAEELAQEAFLRLWRSWDQLRSYESAGGYLYTTVVNLARMSIRARLTQLRHRAVDLLPWGQDIDRDGRVDLQRALARLPGRKRACVVLRYLADLSEKETAAVLGVSVGTVKSQTHKALQLLEDQLLVPGSDDANTPVGRNRGDPAP
jgi:RNA polymerase sigma-70 factor (sigma-E family)